ncbi:hypothetical protein ACFL1E_05440 [Candidatus Omnitrophota bacterium]
MRRLIIGLIIVCCTGTFVFAQGTDSLTITTYYPSPYGVYRIMRLNPLDSSAAPVPACAAAINRGDMFYDDGNAAGLHPGVPGVYTCVEDPPATFSWVPVTGGFWTLVPGALPPDNLLYTTGVDLGEDWFVGIGTATPNSNLQVIGAISRQGTTLIGNQSNTHVNLGNNSTTGEGGEDWAGCTVSGGDGNLAEEPYSTVAGGQTNTATQDWTVVSGGQGNDADGRWAVVAGGENNLADDLHATVGGGEDNQALDQWTTVAGGAGNQATTDYATVSGGHDNTASAHRSTVSGGEDNTASDSRATVGGGEDNTASGERSTIAGGDTNAAAGDYSTISGGANNGAAGNYSFAGGGDNNQVNGDYSTAGGGNGNDISPNYATVAGGSDNDIWVGNYSTVSGGHNNDIGGASAYSTISGGQGNEVNNAYATVSGGQENEANGNYSWAAGHEAIAAHDGAFVWADDQGVGFPYSSTVANSFNIRATGGIFHGGGLIHDIAEFMNIIEADNVQEAELVSIKKDNVLGKSASAYDENLIGVISGKRTTTLHLGNTQAAFDDTVRMPVALAGPVFVKVNGENGIIAVGDAITSSSAPGIGMKATKPGKIVGYAMEQEGFQDTDTGEILVFVNTGYYVPETIAEQLETLQAEIAELKNQIAQLNK